MVLSKTSVEIYTYLSDNDKLLIESAYKQSWEQIDPSEADTPEGRYIINEIALIKFYEQTPIIF